MALSRSLGAILKRIGSTGFAAAAAVVTTGSPGALTTGDAATRETRGRVMGIVGRRTTDFGGTRGTAGRAEVLIAQFNAKKRRKEMDRIIARI